MTTTTFTVKAESEKAINVELQIIAGKYADKQFGWSFWLPKSQITIDENGLNVPQWLIGPKTMQIKGFMDFVK